MKRTQLLLAILPLVLSLAAPAASTDTWVGGSGNNFSTTANWTYSSGSGPVASGDSLVFGGAGSTTPNNDNSGFTYGGLSFSGAAIYTVGGNDFTLASGGSIANSSALTNTINNNITLTGSGGIINPSVANSGLVLGGIISGAANLIKSGNSSSFLTLSGVNTFSGVLTFNAGTVIFTTPPSPSGGNLGNPSSIVCGGSSTTTILTSSGAGSVTISSPTITANASSTALFKNGAASGTTFEISAKLTGAGNCRQNSPSVSGTTVRFSNDTSDFAGNFTMAAGVFEFTSVANAGSASSLGAGSTSYAIVNSTSSATFRYVGSGNTTTTRGIDWQGTTGTLSLDSSGAGSVQFLGSGNLRSTGTGGATLTLTGTSTGANKLSQVVNNDVPTTGATAISKTAAGTWTLAGANTHSGGTTLNAGLLNLGNASALGSGTFTIGGNGSFDNTTGGLITVANAFTLSGGSPVYIGSSDMTINGAVTLSGANRTITVNANNLTLGGVIGDSAQARALTKAGAGKLTLASSSANTYTGGTTNSAGTLLLSGNATLGASGSAVTVSGGTLDLGGTSQTPGAVTFSGASTVTNGTLTATSFVGTMTAGNTANVSATLAGAATGLTQSGAGTLALLGNNTFNGGIFVHAGVLSYNSIAPGGSSCSLGQNSVLNVKNGAYQYFGPTATNSRTFQFSTLSGTPTWNVENAGTNTTLTLSADFVGGTNGGAAGGRTIGLNAHTASDAGPVSTLKMFGVIPDVTPTNSTTVVAGGATGYTVFNGGTVGLLGLSNTFSGAVQVKYARTLQVMSLADSNVPCSIGLGTNPPAGTAPIIIGSTDSQRGGTLAYVGTNDASCNRQICVEGVNFGGQSAAVILNNSPSDNSLHLSCTQPVVYFSGVLISNCSFTLGGSAAAVNVFDLPITNTPLGSASLTVSGSTWQLTAAHSYAGATTVSGGALLLNGSIGGSGVKVSAGTLGGSGTISSPVTVQSGGTLQPGAGGSDIKTLSVSNVLSLAGKTVLLLNRTNAQTASLVTGISTLTNGGTLIITNVGDPLQGGDTFTLFNATNYVGAFSATNLPALSAGLAWDLSTLSVNGTIKVEQAPVAANLTAAIHANQSLVISTAKLVALCSDADGDPLTITSAGPTSTNGGSVSLTSSNVTYVPTTDFVGADLFTYTVSDGRGGSATGSVSVTVSSTNAPSLNIVSGPVILPNGHFHVGFAGIPGYSYTVQYSPNANGPWTTITNLTAGSLGLFDFEDPTEPAPPSRYYRTTYP